MTARPTRQQTETSFCKGKVHVAITSLSRHLDHDHSRFHFDASDLLIEEDSMKGDFMTGHVLTLMYQMIKTARVP